jgi:hypothetical protein
VGFIQRFWHWRVPDLALFRASLELELEESKISARCSYWAIVLKESGSSIVRTNMLLSGGPSYALQTSIEKRLLVVKRDSVSSDTRLKGLVSLAAVKPLRVSISVLHASQHLRRAEADQNGFALYPIEPASIHKLSINPCPSSFWG